MMSVVPRVAVLHTSPGFYKQIVDLLCGHKLDVYLLKVKVMHRMMIRSETTIAEVVTSTRHAPKAYLKQLHTSINHVYLLLVAFPWYWTNSTLTTCNSIM